MSAMRARRSAALVLGVAVVAGPWAASTTRTSVQAVAGVAPSADTVHDVRAGEDSRTPVADPVLVPVELPARQLGTVPTAEPSPPVGTSTAVATPVASGTATAPASSTALGAPLDPDEVSAVLAPLLGGGALGAGPTPARVVDVATGEVLYDAADEPTVPASTMKVVTAASALRGLGPDAVLRTRAVLVNPDAEAPRVVLVGAGDPSLTSSAREVGGSGTSVRPASLRELSDATARALAVRGITRVRVGFDDSLFTGPALHPTWDPSFPRLGIVAPVSALQVDQGRRTPNGLGRVPDPAARAGAVFAEHLAAAGLVVRGDPRRRELGGAGTTLAAVESPTLGVLVERMLATSDNDYAEVLGRLAAASAGEPASFVGVARTARAVLGDLGIDTVGAEFADASGLSRSDRLTPELLTDLLVTRAPGFGSLHSGLPVAGATGSLRTRFRTGDQRPAAGLARAKTGTLTAVTGLAGYLSRPDARLLAFAFVDGSTSGAAFAARAAMDRALAAVVECECASAPAASDPPDPAAPTSP
ncbi:MAG: D-alanyl-D-alanine carboxypeptidase/D-alanyl-D-alanine-endopeptidase [Candidatus Nanopelagicales bacterium]